jgi:3-hydroxyisobutyrate dehydrogenase-like beta-hydroxyacid dehydrogenase
MGASIAANCSGSRFWCAAGRSTATRARAEHAELMATESLAELAERCDTIVSVCPPGEALAVAEQVAATGYDGLYVDANAIAPATTTRIGTLFARYVDGGIIGPPATEAGTTRLYLSGDEAPAVATRWDGSLLDVRAIDGGVGAASAVKMLFAGWGKHNAALLLAIIAVAEAYGVTDAIRDEWAISRPDLMPQAEAAARGTGPKAWRFEGEMHEIAATFEAVGLPPEFHRGAAEVFRRLASFKDGARPADLDEVVAALLGR